MAKISLGLTYKQNELEINNFYKVQEDIKKYLENILHKIEKYPDTPEKDMLLERLKEIINNICLNTIPNLKKQSGSNIMNLDIKNNEQYLIFSLYIFENNGYTYLETPTIVIISKKQNTIYFIEELYNTFAEDGIDFNPVINGFDDINYFEITDKDILEFHMNQEEDTDTLFNNAFYQTNLFTSIIKSNSKQKKYPKPIKKSLNK